MTGFTGLRLMLAVSALVAHSLALPTAKLTATTVRSAQDRTSAQTFRDTLVELTKFMTGGEDATASSRKTESHYGGHKPQHHHHQAISTLIHLLLTISSAFAPLVGAIVGPLLTNIANGITWAISHTIASGFSPPHGLFSPELQGHNEHHTPYAAQSSSDAGSDAFKVQLPVADAAAVDQAGHATVDDTVVETK